MKLHEEFKLYEGMWEVEKDILEDELQEDRGNTLPLTRPYDQNMKLPKRWAGGYFDLSVATDAIDYLTRYTKSLVAALNKALRSYTYTEEVEQNLKAIKLEVDSVVERIRKNGFSDVADKVKKEMDTIIEPIEIKCKILRKANTPAAEVTVPPETLAKFRKQHIRILSLLNKYTNISKADLNNLLAQLEANRLTKSANLQEAQRDFYGI